MGVSKGAVWAADRRNLAEYITREALVRLSHEIRSRAQAHPDDEARKRLYKFAASLQTRGALTRTIPELQALPSITLTHDAFDRDPYLLGTADGTLDLRTGEMREADPANLISRRVEVGPRNRPATRWMKFLAEATDGDEEMQVYLQKLAGYSLTGSIQEQTLHFIHGPPLTGKSVFVSTISGLFGSYHENAPIDTFAESRGDRHPTDLAKLAGSRLVTAVETKEGRSWDLQRIKAITGGDRISARFMHQDFFDYHPAYKIIVVGNHEPEIRGADPAMMRRLHVIPFETAPKVVDRLLTEKLKEEWPEILHWAVEGCLRWLDEGLGKPAAVEARTERYRHEEDPVELFIEDRCVVGLDRQVTRRDLFRAWLQWCHERGEDAGTLKTLRRRFRAKEKAYGFTDSRLVGEGRPTGYLGLGLNADPDMEV